MQRKSGLTGRIAASEMFAGRRLWADHVLMAALPSQLCKVHYLRIAVLHSPDQLRTPLKLRSHHARRPRYTLDSTDLAEDRPCIALRGAVDVAAMGRVRFLRSNAGRLPQACQQLLILRV